MRQIFRVGIGALLLTISLTACQSMQDAGLLHDQEQNYLKTQEGKSLRLPHSTKASQYFEVPELPKQRHERPLNTHLEPPTHWTQTESSTRVTTSSSERLVSGCYYRALDDHWEVPCSFEITWNKLLQDLKKADYQVIRVVPKLRQIYVVDLLPFSAATKRQNRYLLELRPIDAHSTEIRLYNSQHAPLPHHVMLRFSRYLKQSETARGHWLSTSFQNWADPNG